MIVKIKNEDSSWNYYEGDSLNQFMTDGHNEEIPEEAVHNIDKAGGNPVIMYVTKDKKVVHRMVTNRPTYLLNDNGKTIDKLI